MKNDQLSNRKFAAILGLLVVAGLIAISLAQRMESKVDVAKVKAQETAPKEKVNRSLPKPPENWQQRGGIWRPPEGKVNVPAVASNPVSKWVERVGRTKLVEKESNSNTKSVAEALRSNSKSERLSAFVKPADFNAEEFLADPQAYLDVVEPGRAFQSAEYEEGVENIVRTNGFFHELLQGESVLLTTRTAPNMPVSFYSNRLGRFDNQLTSITVQADDQGHAETRFFSTPGSFGDLDVIAASPLNSDQASWLIRVRLPERNNAESADQGRE